ncbi:MAG: hypothetical protein WCL44_04620 [bacterium]
MISTHKAARFLFCAFSLAASILPVGSSLAADRDIDLGPIFTRDTTLDGQQRIRILGPLFEERVATNGRVVKAVRPLFARSIEANGKDSRTDLLWPLATSTTIGNEIKSRFATIYYTDYDKGNPLSRWRLWLLPFLFTGRDAEGRGYFGLFPIIGRIREVLLFDRADFLLFPLYAHTVSDGLHTTDILWPVVSWSQGRGVLRGRFFPFYGRTVRPGISESMFFCWPLFTWARYVKPDQRGSGFVIFPIIGRTYRPAEKSWLFLPPLFRWTRGNNYDEANFPWPFFQMASGRANKFYLWPLGGGFSEPGMSEGFLLWPILRTSHNATGTETVDRLSVLPFLQYAAVRGPQPAAGPAGRETQGRSLKLWPLFAMKTVGATSTLRVPALWPGEDVAPIENTYAPVWTLFSKTDTGDASEFEFLWGMVRRRKGPTESSGSIFPLLSWARTGGVDGAKEWSLLLGLIGYRKQGASGSLRLLFIDFGGRKKDVPSPEPESRGSAKPLRAEEDEETGE